MADFNKGDRVYYDGNDDCVHVGAAEGTVVGADVDGDYVEVVFESAIFGGVMPINNVTQIIEPEHLKRI